MPDKIRIECQAAATLAHTKLEPYQGELKDLSKENYQRLKAEILRDGFSAPIFVWRHDGHHYVLDGHQRLRVIQQMASEGFTIPDLPVAWIDADDERQAKRKILALTSQYGNMTGQGLYEFMHNADLELDDLADFQFPEIDMPSFQMEFFAEPNGTGADGDQIPPVPDDPYVKFGDVWRLGKHTVQCKDATQVSAPKWCNLMVTDPPYGVNYDPGWREKYDNVERHSTDKVPNDDTVDWRQAFAGFHGDVAYVWHAGVFAGPVEASLLAADMVVRSQIIWSKQHFVFGRGAYHWQHEPCWYAVRKGGVAHWAGDRKQSTVWEISNANHVGGELDDVNTKHGAQKPLECMMRPVRNHEGDVYDPFLGSGTTLVACEKLERKCYGVEIEPKYVQVTIERWQQLTGKKARRIKKGAA